MTAAPWQVYVPGFEGEEYASRRDAVRAYRRLKRADRRRPDPPSAARTASASSPHSATDPAVESPARQQQSTSTTSKPSAPHAEAVLGADGDEQLTNEGRT